MWENRCKVAVSGVGFSKVSRTADMPLAAHALTAVKEAVADSGLEMSDIDGLATYPELPATGHAEVDGISVVSVEYRFTDEATADGVVPPVQGPLGDAARAIQFIRSKAKEWNLDKTRIGATGGSAGAASSLWLAFHDDLADPRSDDPVARGPFDEFVEQMF